MAARAMHSRPRAGDGGSDVGRGSGGTKGVQGGRGNGGRDQRYGEPEEQEAEPAASRGRLLLRLRPALEPGKLRDRAEVAERLLPVPGEVEVVGKQALLVPPCDVLAHRRDPPPRRPGVPE